MDILCWCKKAVWKEFACQDKKSVLEWKEQTRYQFRNNGGVGSSTTCGCSSCALVAPDMTSSGTYSTTSKHPAQQRGDEDGLPSNDGFLKAANGRQGDVGSCQPGFSTMPKPHKSFLPFTSCCARKWTRRTQQVVYNSVSLPCPFISLLVPVTTWPLPSNKVANVRRFR